MVNSRSALCPIAITDLRNLRHLRIGLCVIHPMQAPICVICGSAYV